MTRLKILITIAIGIVLIGAGIFLYANSQQNKTKQVGEFSKNARNYPKAKSLEVVELRNGDEYDLTASIVKKNINGTEVKMLAYNGSIPGPLIKVPQGAEITINFKNDTDVDTALHSHGVRLENQFDGVVDVTQKAIPVGGTFTYKVKFPDEGIFWYHPHLREDYAQELGLYGNYLVTPAQKDYWAEVDREEALFLDDISIENGTIAPFSRETVDHTLMGRFGNTMLVNGDDKYKFSIKQGERVRFYLTNAASTRVFNVSIPNARMKLVGADNGKYEREEWVDTVLLGPSERQVVEVWFDKAGDYQILHKTPSKTYMMGSIAVEQYPVTTSYFMVPRENQDIITSLKPLRPLFTKPADKTLNLTLDMMGNMMQQDQENNASGHSMEGMDHGSMMMEEENSTENDGTIQKIEWEDDMGMMNAMSDTKMIKWKLVDAESKKENMDIKWQFKKGDKVKLRLFNDPKSQHPMQHPMHIHGQRFLVLNTNGVSSKNLVWKDTVLVQTGDSVEILVDMDNPGDWMIHCHIPEHMEAGMMSQFKVI